MVASHSQGPLQMNSSCQLPLLCAVMYIWYICYNVHTNDTINVTNQMVRNVVLWLVHFWHSKTARSNESRDWIFPFLFFLHQSAVCLLVTVWMEAEWACLYSCKPQFTGKGGEKKRNQTETREDDDCDNMWWKRGMREKFTMDQDPGLIHQLGRVIREMFPELHSLICSSSLSSSGI